ncbi:hypothetical protein BS47DRAFT_1364086 [Hydnum rufescens UP504]|uniref:Zinc finger GRF-type domain-containing protein n=1 Tax=Hydnum rufescens UP504 TaxID=1448309 RepID=A0A9P6ASQ8_9AGAM|nr:hypothetical protein BS47DRAFT_1364086 [Hydnum rufescens UP504]
MLLVGDDAKVDMLDLFSPNNHKLAMAKLCQVPMGMNWGKEFYACRRNNKCKFLFWATQPDTDSAESDNNANDIQEEGAAASDTLMEESMIPSDCPGMQFSTIWTSHPPKNIVTLKVVIVILEAVVIPLQAIIATL